MDSILSLVSEHDDLFASSAPSSQRRRSSTQVVHDFFSPASKRHKSSAQPLTQPSASQSSASRSSHGASRRRPPHTPASASQPSASASPRVSLSPPDLLSFTRPYSIVSVTMRSFMCYAHHTVRLGPHLNMVLGPNGVGKCFARGTLLRLYNGDTIAVEAVRGGEQLMGDDGQPRTVDPTTLVHYDPQQRAEGQPREVLYEIAPRWDGAEPFVVNGAHILVLYNNTKPRVKKRSDTSWRVQQWYVDTDNVMRERTVSYASQAAAEAELRRRLALWRPVLWQVSVDAYRASSAEVQRLCMLTASKPITFHNPQLSSLFDLLTVVLRQQPTAAQLDYVAWWLGVWVAVGLSDRVCISQDGAPPPDPHHHHEIFARLHDYTRLFNEPVQQLVGQRSSAGWDVFGFQYGMASVAGRVLQAYGVINNKHIPRALICDSLDIRRRFLAGLIDGDGYRHPSNVYEIQCKQRHAIDGYKELAATLGLRCSAAHDHVCTCQQTGAQYNGYRIIISSHMWDVVQYCAALYKRCPQSGTANYVVKDKDTRCYSLTVTDVGEGEYFGFGVIGGANRRFLLADYTVTHNSTVVCAICLGLGGDERSLGRVPTVSGYIKRAQAQAEVEVELFEGMRAKGGHGNLSIRRTITPDDRSVYHEHTPHGGWRKVTHTYVRELMASCHIQVDNLCVLLAQDRVGKFAELKPTELLQETEKAADADIYNKHLRLIELRRAEKSSESGVSDIRRQLEGAQEEINGMEPEMKRLEERKAEEEKLEWMQRRRPWVEYRHEERKAERLKGEKRAAEALVEQEKETHRPLRRVLERIKREHQESEAKRVEAETEMDRHKRKRGDILEALRVLSATVEKKQDEIQRAEDEQDQHEQDMERQERRVTEQEQKVAALQDDTEAREQAKRADMENREILKGTALLTTDANAANRAIADVQADLALIDRRRQERVAQQSSRADTLFKRAGHERGRTLAQEYATVQAAKARQAQYRMKLNTDPTFIHDPEERRRMNDPEEPSYVLKGEVYGPLALELDWKDDQVGQVLEDLIPFGFKFAYIVRELDDWQWLSKRVDNKQHRLNTSNRKLTPQALAARAPLQQYSALGVVGYLSDYVRAEPLVMHWMCDQYPLTTLPFGNRDVSSEQLETLLAKRPPAANENAIMQLYTLSRKYGVRFSKYGHRDRSLTDTAVAPIRLFSRQAGGGEDEERLNAAEEGRRNLLRQQLAGKQAELAEVEQKQGVMRRRFDQLGELRERYRRTLEGNARERTTLAKWKKELAEQQRNSDVIELKRRLTNDINKAQQVQVTRAKELTAAEQQWVEAVARADVWTVQTHHKHLEREAVEIEWDKAAQKLRQLDADKKKLQKDVDECLMRVNKLKSEALRVCREEETLGAEWLADDISLEALKERIEMAKESLEQLRRHDNHGLVERYERTRAAIDQLAVDLEEAERQHRGRASEVEALRKEWLTFIRALVFEVNKTFSAQFRRERWDGEVKLVEHSDFEQYAISILVNFHPDKNGSTQKQQLSAGRQSGGEKSVTTMLYLLCLQSVTDAPFRIVDEINQGMDPVNEERIFGHIVRASSTMHNVNASIKRKGRRAAEREQKQEVDEEEAESKEEAAEEGEDDEKESVVSVTEHAASSSSPQYILVSPKLLPGLDMPEDVGMRVLIMMGGRMGQQTADRRKQKAGQLSVWEKPESIVNYAEQWMRHKQRMEADESKEERTDEEDASGAFDSDSETDSEDEEEDNASAAEASQPAARGGGRGGRRHGRVDEDDGAIDMEDVDLLVELEHNWRRLRSG